MPVRGEDLRVRDTASIAPPDSSRAAIAPSQLAGFPMRMAVAIVSGCSTGSPRTSGAAPWACHPSIRGVRLACPSRSYSRYPRQYAVMLPALPTGMQCTSGASPSTSTISNDAVFCPSIRCGLIEFTTVTSPKRSSSRTMSSASSKLPVIGTTFAPWMSACASLPSAIWPCGMTTPHVSPARAAYAAADADVFPVDAHTTTFTPASTAFEIAIVMPRSLNEPVGFAPSIFRYTSRLNSSDSRSACSNGVPPSSSVMTGVASLTGRCSR